MCFTQLKKMFSGNYNFYDILLPFVHKTHIRHIPWCRLQNKHYKTHYRHTSKTFKSNRHWRHSIISNIITILVKIEHTIYNTRSYKLQAIIPPSNPHTHPLPFPWRILQAHNDKRVIFQLIHVLRQPVSTPPDPWKQAHYSPQATTKSSVRRRWLPFCYSCRNTSSVQAFNTSSCRNTSSGKCWPAFEGRPVSR